MADNFYYEERTDPKTGEIIRRNYATHFRSDEPNHVKIYLDMWCIVKEIKGINTNFLYCLLPYMTYADPFSKQFGDIAVSDEDIATLGQVITLNKWVREQIGIKLNWSTKGNSLKSRFSNELNKLCKAKVLRKICNNTYQVNPAVIGKGTWSQIRRLKEVTFDLWNKEVVNVKTDDSKDIPF